MEPVCFFPRPSVPPTRLFFCGGLLAFVQRILQPLALFFEREAAAFLCVIGTDPGFGGQFFRALAPFIRHVHRAALEFDPAFADLFAGFLAGLRRHQERGRGAYERTSKNPVKKSQPRLSSPIGVLLSLHATGV